MSKQEKNPGIIDVDPVTVFWITVALIIIPLLLTGLIG